MITNFLSKCIPFVLDNKTSKAAHIWEKGDGCTGMTSCSAVI